MLPVTLPSQFFEANIHYHNYSLLESAVMLLLDTLCLSVLFLYLDQVMPREALLSQRIQRPHDSHDISTDFNLP